MCMSSFPRCYHLPTTPAEHAPVRSSAAAGIERDESGVASIMHEGTKYIVYEDPEQHRAWFQSTATGDSRWEDPRTGADPITTESLNDVAPPAVKKGSKLIVYMVAVLPVILLFGGLMGRIYYLHVSNCKLLRP